MTVLSPVNLEKIDDCFPFQVDGKPSYYPGQRETIIQIIEAFDTGAHCVIANCPTGTGKSPIADTIRKYYGGRALGITPKNVLVDQYLSLDWKAVKGASNYTCQNYGGMSCRMGIDESRHSGRNKRKAIEGCSDGCPYATAVKEAFRAEADGVITNPHFIWAHLEDIADICAEKPFPFMVIDEAHLLESTLSDIIKVSITKEHVQMVEYMTPLTAYEDITPWVKGFQQAAAEKLKDLHENIKLSGGDKAARKKYASEIGDIDRLTQQIRMYSEHQADTQWLRFLQQDEDNNFQSLLFDPVYGGFMANKIFSLAPRVLLMSATMLDKNHSCSELGIEPKNCIYIDVPSYYPPENQPLLFDDSLKLSYKKMPDLLPRLIEKIDFILDRNPGKRGVIHTVSHSLAAAIYEKSRNRKRLTYSRTMKQSEMVSRHEKKRDSVLLGPAWIEGLDLKGELGEFCIIAKVPFQPIQTDQKLQIRVRDHPGYSELQSIRNLVQAKGRVIRGPEEKADTFCLDGNLWLLLNRNRDYFPSSFLETIREFPIGDP